MLNKWRLIQKTHGLDLDDPQLTIIRREILKKKNFLHKIYDDWYRLIQSFTNDGGSPILEVGSGAGFSEEIFLNVNKSDVLFLPSNHLVMSALDIPFSTESLQTIILVNVFHHLPAADRFLENAQRILKTNGRMIMIEPWMTPWSHWILSKINPEPTDVNMKGWRFYSNGPLSDANAALPWIVFQRDKEDLNSKYPDLRIIHIQPMMPFRYFLSGGMSSWFSFPGFSYSVIDFFENLFARKMDSLGMFALIVLEKK